MMTDALNHLNPSSNEQLYFFLFIYFQYLNHCIFNVKIKFQKIIIQRQAQSITLSLGMMEKSMNYGYIQRVKQGREKIFIHFIYSILYIFISHLYFDMEIYRIMRSLVIILLALDISNCLQFRTRIQPHKQKCFYQILQLSQKYKFDVSPLSSHTYSVQVHHLNKNNQNWQTQYSKKSANNEQLNIHKLASVSSTFRFCLTNNNSTENSLFQITLASGLELLELHLLPDNSDTENMALQMEWIQKETKNLNQMLNKLTGMRSSVEALSSIVGSKMIGWVLGFSFIVLLLNGIFYSGVKKMLNQRKMI